jgi:hypothetical protein
MKLAKGNTSFENRGASLPTRVSFLQHKCSLLGYDWRVAASDTGRTRGKNKLERRERLQVGWTIMPDPRRSLKLLCTWFHTTSQYYYDGPCVM